MADQPQKYWVVMEYAWPQGEENPADTVRPILSQYGKLGHETGAQKFTVYTDKDELSASLRDQIPVWPEES